MDPLRPATRNAVIGRFSPARGVLLGAVLLAGLLLGPVGRTQAAVTAYQVQNCDNSGNLDADCSVGASFVEAQTIEMIVDGSESCSGDKLKEDKIQFDVSTPAETDVLTTYYGTGYGSNMDITTQSSGNDIYFKSKDIGGTFTLYLYEADPSDGSLIGGPLDSITKSVTAGTKHTWTDLSGLTGTVQSGNALAFKMTFTPADSTSSQIETKWGIYDTTEKRALFSVDETIAISPLTGVGNTPSPNTAGDTATHTVAFTTADDLPADGKIVITFPAGFDISGVGNGDISSGTGINGTFTVSDSGQVLTIARDGNGALQSAGAENIIIDNVINTSTANTSYTVDVETRDSSDSTINGPTTSSAFTIKGKSALANPDTQVTDQLGGSVLQPTDVELVGFKITPTGENLTWTDLVVSLSYGGGMADADITNARIYIDNGTVGTYESGTDTQVGAQSVNASSGSLTWDTVAGTISAATNYLIIFDAGATLSEDETVQASVTAANITVTGATSSQSITTSGDVTNEPLHTFSSCGNGHYAYKRSITIDHTKVGTDNSGALSATGFPVLVSLSGNWLKTTTADPTNGRIESGDGWDIIFRDSDGHTQLDHEIEEYDGTTGTLVAWVRVDSLSKQEDTTIYMYYGNGCIDSATEDPENVWDDSFKGVWHLKEDPSTAGADGIEDSTANGHDGTDQGGMDSGDQIPGKIAGSLTFDAVGKYIDYGDVNDFDFGASNFSVSLWVKGGGDMDPLVTKSNYDTGCSNTTGVYIYRDHGELPADQYAYYHQSGCGIFCIGCSEEYLQSGEDGTDGKWHHLAVVREGTGSNQLKLYVDGSLADTGTQPTSLSNSNSFRIHRWNDDTADTVDGTQIDEVRVSNADRDYD